MGLGKKYLRIAYHLDLYLCEMWHCLHKKRFIWRDFEGIYGVLAIGII